MLSVLRISLFLALTWPSFVWAQATVLQGGPWAAGHAPVYAGDGGSQPVLMDSGGAGGGVFGEGLSELGITSRSATGAYPAASSGSGPFGTHSCMYDAPVTNSTGYHYLCFDSNANGGGMLAYGASGGAGVLPFALNVNGTTYSFPLPGTGTVVGPGSSVAGHIATWTNASGVLIGDSGIVATSLAPLVSPNFTTPVLGAATATTINKLTLTAPATGSTLTIADGKTLTVSNTLTLTGTDSSTLAIGAGGTLTTAAFTAIGTSGATIPLLSVANTWTAAQNMLSGVALGADPHLLYDVNATTIGIRIGAAGPYFNIRTVAGSNMDLNNASGGSVTFSSGGTLLATVNTAGALTLTGGLTTASSTLHTTTTALTNGAAAALGTLTNAPAAGNPTKWVPINDNGTTRYIPAW